MSLVRYKGVISGNVQGVGYRYFARREAERLGITGIVKNLDSGDVEFEAQGDESDVRDYIEILKHGHQWATIIDLQLSEMPVISKEDDFKIFI